MGNLKTKKICVIGDSQWCQKLMDITYEMGVLGGVVESNLKRYMFLLKLDFVLLVVLFIVKSLRLSVSVSSCIYFFVCFLSINCNPL
jgi:hypothetical protein